jgi:hypothetical protein
MGLLKNRKKKGFIIKYKDQNGVEQIRMSMTAEGYPEVYKSKESAQFSIKHIPHFKLGNYTNPEIVEFPIKMVRGGALQSYTTAELAADLGISKKQMEVNKYDRDDLIALAEQQGLIKSDNNKTCYTIGGL